MWMPHLPGQHYDVRLTAPDGYTAQRSYSIASSPLLEGVDRAHHRPPRRRRGVAVLPRRHGRGRPGRGPRPVRLLLRLARRGAGSAGRRGLRCGAADVDPPPSTADHARAPMRLVYSVREPEDVIYAGELGADALLTYTREPPAGLDRPRGPHRRRARSPPGRSSPSSRSSADRTASSSRPPSSCSPPASPPSGSGPSASARPASEPASASGAAPQVVLDLSLPFGLVLAPALLGAAALPVAGDRKVLERDRALGERGGGAASAPRRPRRARSRGPCRPGSRARATASSSGSVSSSTPESRWIQVRCSSPGVSSGCSSAGSSTRDDHVGRDAGPQPPQRDGDRRNHAGVADHQVPVGLGVGA